jgi:hypothetical protein
MEGKDKVGSRDAMREGSHGMVSTACGLACRMWPRVVCGVIQTSRPRLYPLLQP